MWARRFPLVRLAVAASALFLAPAASLVLTSTNVTRASLTPRKELLPITPVSFDLRGVTGELKLTGRFSPEAGHALPARGVLHIVLTSTDSVDSVSILLHRGVRRSITFPQREHPRTVSLTYVPSLGSELGAALIVTDLSVAWDKRPSLGRRVWGALRAWLCPSAIQKPVGLFYVLSLLIGILTLSGVLIPPAPRRALGLGNGWPWLFLSVLLLCSFPSAFSPLTRVPLLGSALLCTVVLAATALMLVKTTFRAPAANRYAYIPVLLGCGLIRILAAREIMDRQPKDIDEIVYLGVAQNLVLGHGIMVPDSAYKTRNMEHIDPVRKLWWKNDLYLGISRKGERTAAIPPVYPLVLSLFVSRDGVVHGSAYIMQAILGMATCLLLYMVGTRAVGFPAALAGLLLAAMHGPMAAVSRYLFTETVFFFLLVLAVFFLLERRCSLLSGATLAMAVLTRSVALVLLPVWIAFAYFQQREPARSWKIPAITLVGFLLVVAPWAIRNFRTVGEATIGSTFAGKDLFVGNNDTYRRLTARVPQCRWDDLGALQQTLLTLSGIKKQHVHQMFWFPARIPEESARSTELRRRSLAFMIAYPRPFLKLAWKRVLSLFELLDEPPPWSLSGHLPVLLWPILFLSLIGLVLGEGAFSSRLFLVVSAVLILMPPLLSIGFPRYRLPFDLLLCPVAGAGFYVVAKYLWLPSVDDSPPSRLNSPELNGAPSDRLCNGSV